MVVFAVLFLIPVLGLQESGESRKKPVLIRVDPDEAASNREGGKPALTIPDRETAREHVNIGNFYFKKDNFQAAAGRYRDAIECDSKWVKPYEKLVRTLEKLGSFQEALEICQQFIEIDSTSKDVKRFQKWHKELSERASKEASSEAGE